MKMADSYRTQMVTKFKLVKMHSLKAKEIKRLQYLLRPVMTKKTSLETRLMRSWARRLS